MGPYTDGSAEMGPLVTPDHYSKVKSYVDLGVEEGADLVVDGRDFSLKGYEEGAFLGGCLFDNVKPDMKIYTDEIFGPVLSIVRVDSYEEAVSLAQPTRIWKRRSNFYTRRRVCTGFHFQRKDGNGGSQCADTGSRCLSQLWRLETVAIR